MVMSLVTLLKIVGSTKKKCRIAVSTPPAA
jgi:hypothetical protein